MPARGKRYPTYVHAIQLYTYVSLSERPIQVLKATRGARITLVPGDFLAGYRNLRMFGRPTNLPGCLESRGGSSANLTRSPHSGLDRVDASGIPGETVEPAYYLVMKGLNIEHPPGNSRFENETFFAAQIRRLVSVALEEGSTFRRLVQ